MVVRDAGRDLDTAVPVSRSSDEGPRRGPALGVEHPPPGPAAGGVGEGGAEARDVQGVASATCTAPGSPSASRLARARATRTGSRSTPAAVSPARAKASRSPPMPQPRSMTLAGWAAASRAARCSATRKRVACSSASGVKNIAARSVAELRDRLRPQLHLGGGRGRPVGVGLGAAHRRGGADRVTAMIDPCVGRLLQQPPAGIGPEPGQRLEVHATHPVRRFGCRSAPDVTGSPPCASCCSSSCPSCSSPPSPAPRSGCPTRRGPPPRRHPRRPARRRPAGGPQHRRAGAVGPPPGHPDRAGGRHRGRRRHAARLLPRRPGRAAGHRRHRPGGPAPRRHARGPGLRPRRRR